ncbi:hypothetical protein [Pimelobacter simplex]|uniref:hypothetical protein n=1 Tax=Nocardioides simplex TaxID=2045 RepID=UPI003AAC186B
MKTSLIVALAGGSIAMALPAVALMQSPAQAAGCSVFATRPVAASAYDEVRGSGGRSGCTTSKQILVELKWDRPLSPDPVLDYRSGTYKNVTLNVAADCLAGAHDYHVDVSGAAGSIDSDKRKITGLNC